MAAEAKQFTSRKECDCGVVVGSNYIIEVVGLDHGGNQQIGDKLIMKSCGYHDDGKHSLHEIRVQSAQAQGQAQGDSLSQRMLAMEQKIEELQVDNETNTREKREANKSGDAESDSCSSDDHRVTDIPRAASTEPLTHPLPSKPITHYQSTTNLPQKRQHTHSCKCSSSCSIHYLSISCLISLYTIISLLSCGARLRICCNNDCIAFLSFGVSVIGYICIISMSFILNEFWLGLFSLIAAILTSIASNNTFKMETKINQYAAKCNTKNNKMIDISYGLLLFGLIQGWLLYELYLKSTNKNISNIICWVTWASCIVLLIVISPMLIINIRFCKYSSYHHTRIQNELLFRAQADINTM